METASVLPQSKSVLAKLIAALDNKAVAVDLLVGWFVWVTIIAVCSLRASESEVLNYSLLENIGTHWQSAFLWSLPAVLAVSLIHHRRLNRPWHAAFTTCVLYIGPMAMAHLGLMLLDQQYQGYRQAHDARQTLGLITIVFYLIGIGYLAVKARQNDNQAIAALLIPPYVGVILTVTVSLFQVFTSLDYRYRKAFQLTVQKVETKGGQVHITGTLLVTKPGSYNFAAISNREFDIADDPSAASATLTWTNGTPSAEGAYTFTIACKDFRTSRLFPLNGEHTESSADFISEGDIYDPWGFLQISIRPNEGREPTKSLKWIPILTWEAMENPTGTH